MNALVQYEDKLRAQVESIIADLTEVRSWDDFARRFLLGEGKSLHTTRSYLASCKQFYDFHGGAHPVETGTPAHIEQYYDSLIAKGLDLNTAVLRVRGLRYMYKRLAERLPYFTDPFTIMTNSLKAKLNRSKRDESERDALTEGEYRAVLAMLRDEKRLTDYALFRFGCTSGMRAAELAGLRWENTAETETGYRATFTGKGAKTRSVPIEQAAYRAALAAFRAQYGRKPLPGERVFNAEATGRSKGEGMSTATIGYRVRAIAERAKAAGLVRSNLHVSPHVMRHTCATRLVSAGVPIDQVQRHLGHASLSTTAVYLHSAIDLTPVFARMAGEAA